MIVAEGVADVADVDDFVAELDAIGEACGCAVTAFDARYVAGRRHLEAAVDRANRAFARDDAIADDRGIEILLYAAGRRQIQQALEMGVSEGRWPVVVVVDGGAGIDGGGGCRGDGRNGEGAGGDEAEAVDRVYDLLEPGDVLGAERDEGLIRQFFGITETELGATDASLETLVVERVSLLAIDK